MPESSAAELSTPGRGGEADNPAFQLQIMGFSFSFRDVFINNSLFKLIRRICSSFSLV